MYQKRFRLTLAFNANKIFDRQVIEGIGEYLQVAQCDWDIFIDEDFRSPLDTLQNWHGDGMIADMDNPALEQAATQLDIPVVGIGGSYRNPDHYPDMPYVATDNHKLLALAFDHLRSKGLQEFAFYSLPSNPAARWADEREQAFREMVSKDGFRVRVFQGEPTTANSWEHSKERLEQWLKDLPKPVGIIAVTDSRARHLLQSCDHMNIRVPDEVAIIGIDNEDMARFLNRVSLSSVEQGCKRMGYEAARMLHRLLTDKPVPKEPRVIEPTGVFGRQSTDYRALSDPYVIQAMHFIRHNACQGIKVGQVVDYVGISRTNLEARFSSELGCSMHEQLHMTKFNRARSLIHSTDLSFEEVARSCGYPSVQYMYTVFRKNLQTTPREYRMHSRMTDSEEE